MDDRLVIGWGPLSRQVANEECGPVTVVVPPAYQDDIPTTGKITAVYADPTDPAVFADLDVSVRSIFIGGADPKRNVKYATAARAVFTAVPIIAYTTGDLDDHERSLLTEQNVRRLSNQPFIDKVLDGVASEEADRSLGLRRMLQSLDGTLAVVTHDNPDPDAIASAVGLTSIAQHYGIDATPCYFGGISHQQNRAMINLLEIDLRNLSAPGDIEDYDHVAIVDHTLPGVNDQLPPDTSVDIVIDHHQASRPPEGRFIDHRDKVGATSTLITQHLDRLSVPYDQQIATALYFGIRVDTDSFTRQTAGVDYEAATVLIENVDFGLLEQIESPTVSQDTFRDIGTAVSNRQRHDSIVISYLGTISDRDSLSQAAEWLLRLDDIDTVLAYGIHDDMIHCSGRHRGNRLSLDLVFRSAFDDIGSAGGHEDMAGAQIPIGYLYDDQEAADRDAVIRSTISNLFLNAVDWVESTAVTSPIDSERPSFQSTGSTFEQMDQNDRT